MSGATPQTASASTSWQPAAAGVERTLVLSRRERAIVVEALAAALVEDYRADTSTSAPGDSPTGHARQALSSVCVTAGAQALDAEVRS